MAEELYPMLCFGKQLETRHLKGLEYTFGVKESIFRSVLIDVPDKVKGSFQSHRLRRRDKRVHWRYSKEDRYYHDQIWDHFLISSMYSN